MISKLAKSIAHFFVVQNITEESKEVIYAGCANQWKQALGTDVVATTSARAASAVEAFFAMLISFFITNPSFQTVQISQALSVDKT